jgi:DNA gyrase/topoisomerase IV subunit A
MTRAFAIAAILLLVAGGAASAHEHKVLGTVTTTASDHLMMTTTDGKAVTVKVTPNTKVTRGKDTVRITDLKEGTRIVVTTESDSDPFTAKLIQVGVTKPSKK